MVGVSLQLIDYTMVLEKTAFSGNARKTRNRAECQYYLHLVISG